MADLSMPAAQISSLPVDEPLYGAAADRIRDQLAEPSDLAVAIRIAQLLLAEHEHVDPGDILALNHAHQVLRESLRILLRAIGAEAVDEQDAETYVAPSPSCTRCYGADAVRFVAQGGATAPCPVCGPSEVEPSGKNLPVAEQAAVRRSVDDQFPAVAAFLATERGEQQ
ncbi:MULTISPECIES: hypothetical protein [Streptomyces]|uniref:Uncharacterized protein n=1 Tax=Streptomyces dengpaensis TaxID=2049881 RepID=A0ABM6STI6_9ACTN|nr:MULTISPECIES: hypothetical protein [Streptomyces]AVH57869.1 hypothetical protein C4B68_21240 [Streptomyces dengpaensis]PIB04834.1 hypothetical protein B1C81_31295 [Streptomyces sp. HG99]